MLTLTLQHFNKVTMPDFTIEDSTSGIVAGVDEAGRGPWAGPVVAAAVIVNRDIFPEGIDDSKKLSAKKREELFIKIMGSCGVGIGLSSTKEIDDINILQATMLAMQRAVSDLPQIPDMALIDGNRVPILPCQSQTIIKGDSKSFSIAAASIIAKVTRDRIMSELATEFPHYGWEKNSGYGVKQHKEALEEHGVTPHHRKSFKPIAKLLLCSL